ncbi:hypothetical protein [Niameybacter sp.]
MKIDKDLPYKRFYPKLVKKNKGPRDVYVLCTPPRPGNLFEIIPAYQIDKRYEQSFILGISKDKSWLIDYTVTLIDGLYNTNSLTYDLLQSE